jgi:hypothetical protein
MEGLGLLGLLEASRRLLLSTHELNAMYWQASMPLFASVTLYSQAFALPLWTQ